jgi:hypothetical protein
MRRCCDDELNSRSTCRSIRLYKTEVIHHSRPWRTLQALEYAMLEWVDWFNHRRLLEPNGNVPPAELEASHYQSTGQLPMAADSNRELFGKLGAVPEARCIDGLRSPSFIRPASAL